jgi:excinuclease ABC subunit B
VPPFPDRFLLRAPWPPAGDQPQAIQALSEGIRQGIKEQVLLGVTGSGKTYTMAGVIAAVNRPTLVIAHNKTLAAQLAGEFKSFFPDNAVEYFVSYYDYYQPEAYIPTTDTYIEKDATINDEIDKLRHSATSALFERRDVIIVASVSCIFGLGSPEDYRDLCVSLRPGMLKDRDEVIRGLVSIHYTRNDVERKRGTFRVRGDVLEVMPASETDRIVRVEWLGDEIERITEVDAVTGEVYGRRDHVAIFPASHYITGPDKMRRALASIREELAVRLSELREQGKLLQAQRLEQRTLHDLEMLEEVGYCAGIENYSRHLTGRAPGEPPYTLLDFFPPDFLTIVDESHQTLPQVRAMFEGDRSRKATLVEHGFRLPSALDNRPLTFEEFEARIGQVIYVSATPGAYERRRAARVVEQIVRPTGLLDPEVEVRPVAGQVDDLLGEIRTRASRGERVLVTTLTKKMAEDLTDYLREVGVKVRYLHSDVETLERMAILRDLRLGAFDVLVGINLLREGLDLPEVSLVAILDADKEGYLRSETALIQIMGRAARNVHGKVILYADQVTESMARAMAETRRRREIQAAYNARHGIVPRTGEKEVREVPMAVHPEAVDQEAPPADRWARLTPRQLEREAERIRKEMKEAARLLEFERAAVLRDVLIELEAKSQKVRATRPSRRAAGAGS